MSKVRYTISYKSYFSRVQIIQRSHKKEMNEKEKDKCLSNTVGSTYLELGYLEYPDISNKSPGPDFFYLYKSYRQSVISNTFRAKIILFST